VADGVPPASGDFAAGAQVAGYRLAEQIGWGGMAVVYRALDVNLDRWVALKILAPEIGRDSSFRQRFIFESRAAAAVDHPHIIPVFEAGEAGGVLFIAMRYVGGGDVRTLARRLGPLDPARVASIIAQVASALDAAHAVGLVHRDVKPANMLLGVVAGGGHPDHVYLSDFGLSKQAMATGGLTQTGQFVGTLDYMAPEQIESQPVDGRADLYALACAAFEMLAGEPPFNRGEDLGRLFAQLSAPPPAVTARRPGLPPAVDQVLARAMAKSPADRQQSCREFSAALAAACGLSWSAGGQPIPGPPRAATELAGPIAAGGQPAGRNPAGGALRPPGSWPSAPPTRRQQRGSEPVRPARTAAETGVAAAGRGRDGQQTRGQGTGGRPAYGRAGQHGPPGGYGPGGHGPEPSYPPSGAYPPPRSYPPPGSYPPPHGSYPPVPYPPPVPRGGSAGRSLAIAAIVILVVLGIAGGAFVYLRHNGAGPASGTAATSPPATSGLSGATGNPRPAGPASTVRAYIAAINRHDYARAWNLGGRNISNSSYPAFRQGFSTTVKDTLTVESVSGNVVTARLSAQQKDGSVKTFHGTYTVKNGVITSSNIR
jgi:serine/threonine-protein kinase